MKNNRMALVGDTDDSGRIQQEHARKDRETRIAALAVDRSRYLGDAGQAIERRLAPLTGVALARKEKCDELVRAAKADESLTTYQVLVGLAGLSEE